MRMSSLFASLTLLLFKLLTSFARLLASSAFPIIVPQANVPFGSVEIAADTSFTQTRPRSGVRIMFALGGIESELVEGVIIMFALGGIEFELVEGVIIGFVLVMVAVGGIVAKMLAEAGVKRREAAVIRYS